MDVVGEQPARRGEDARAEVAGGELPQLTGQDGDAERRQGRAEQGDAVALQQGADGVQPALHRRGHGLRGHDDHVAVPVEQGLHAVQGLLQGLPVDVLQDDGGRGALVLCGQRHVGTGDSDDSGHARSPRSDACPARRRSSGAPNRLHCVTTSAL
ncbi:hypothetical protein H1R13_26005 [Streptomyces mexicanus]|uniref:Uncharacterized protein n=1 Tax=Streptomyces mexicanus TaxID=178566 RepID=A0A7X1I3W0_9ACTN|nr:hypothetical protein [Streptomyces mexicanus]